MIQFHFHISFWKKKYPKLLIQKDTCTPMFTAVLFKIAMILTQPKWSRADELVFVLNEIQLIY